MPAPPVIDTSSAARTNTFLAQLKFWTLHCGLTALPSLCLALLVFNSTRAVLAMLCGIATFIFAYAALTSTPLYGKVHAGLIGRSIKLGARIRMIISLASLPLLIPLIGINMESSGGPPESIMFVPDFWFGFAAIAMVNITAQTIGWSNAIFTGIEETNFLTTYAITIVEGILISVSLVTIAFITLIILNIRKNRRQLPSQHFSV